MSFGALIYYLRNKWHWNVGQRKLSAVIWAWRDFRKHKGDEELRSQICENAKNVLYSPTSLPSTDNNQRRRRGKLFNLCATKAEDNERNSEYMSPGEILCSFWKQRTMKYKWELGNDTQRTISQSNAIEGRKWWKKRSSEAKINEALVEMKIKSSGVGTRVNELLIYESGICWLLLFNINCISCRISPLTLHPHIHNVARCVFIIYAQTVIFQPWKKAEDERWIDVSLMFPALKHHESVWDLNFCSF